MTTEVEVEVAAYESLVGVTREFAQWLHGRVVAVEREHDLSAVAPGGAVNHLLGEFKRELRSEQAGHRQREKERRS